MFLIVILFYNTTGWFCASACISTNVQLFYALLEIFWYIYLNAVPLQHLYMLLWSISSLFHSIFDWSPFVSNLYTVSVCDCSLFLFIMLFMVRSCLDSCLSLCYMLSDCCFQMCAPANTPVTPPNFPDTLAALARMTTTDGKLVPAPTFFREAQPQQQPTQNTQALSTSQTVFQSQTD